MDKIKELNKKVKDLSRAVERLDNLDLDIYDAEGQYNYLMRVVNMAEDLAITARKMPESYREVDDYPFTCEEINESVPVEFSTLANGIEKITFERVLPLRRQGNTVKHYFFNLYYPYIKKKYENMQRNEDSPMTFCYVYYYNNEKHIRDYDNIETKVIQDLVAPFFLVDDSPKFLSRYDMCLVGEPRMELYIMKESQFMGFYQKLKRIGVMHEKVI